jgi:hypothetical protein
MGLVIACVCAWAAGGCSSKSGSAADGAAGDAAPEVKADGAGGAAATDSHLANDKAQDTPPPPMVCRHDGGWDIPQAPDGACDFQTDDTDRDGVRDCEDGCPYDPLKIAPGVCGCGIPDRDSDGDGIPDCIDECPMDPKNNMITECGCVDSPLLAAKDAPCSDPSCPGSGTTCDGAGVCGDRSACAPCPSGKYFANDTGTYYWLCGGSLPPVTTPTCAVEDNRLGAPATRAAAQSACAAKGLALVRIQSLTDNRFLVKLLTSPTWIGANDLQTPGQWYWSSAKTDSDALLWSGGADGGAPNNLFQNWAAHAPGSGSCAAIRPDGQWIDMDCGQQLPYVCAYSLGLLGR